MTKTHQLQDGPRQFGECASPQSDLPDKRDRRGVEAYPLKHLPMERRTCGDCRELKGFSRSIPLV